MRRPACGRLLDPSVLAALVDQGEHRERRARELDNPLQLIHLPSPFSLRRLVESPVRRRCLRRAGPGEIRSELARFGLPRCHLRVETDVFAERLGPTIDDLVAVAIDAGWEKTTPRTIRSWVEKGFVSRPRQQARKWRYPNVAVGQVDALARMLARDVHRDFWRFGLFVETGTGATDQVRAFLIEYLGYWRQAVAEHQQRLADPDALRDEAEKAARQKGKNAPLPHRVRVTLDERTLAMQFMLAQLSAVSLPEDEQAAGQHHLERLVGLRSGRGGQTRDISDLSVTASNWPPDAESLVEAVKSASQERIEFTRRMVEIGVVWFPAMRSMLGVVAAGPAASTALIDVMGEWEEKISAEQYALLFAISLANARKNATDEQIRETLPALRPEPFAAMLLSECSIADRVLALKRLGIYPRMRLGAFLEQARSSHR